MADSPFQTAAKAAVGAFYTTGGEAVTYARGSIDVELTAVRNRISAEVPDTDGVFAREDRLEFQVLQATLDLGAGPVEPQRGDTITDADGRIYDVQDDFEPLEQSGEWQIPVVEVDA
jgi:hypothetical protein